MNLVYSRLIFGLLVVAVTVSALPSDVNGATHDPVLRKLADLLKEGEKIVRTLGVLLLFAGLLLEGLWIACGVQLARIDWLAGPLYRLGVVFALFSLLMRGLLELAH